MFYTYTSKEFWCQQPVEMLDLGWAIDRATSPSPSPSPSWSLSLLLLLCCSDFMLPLRSHFVGISNCLTGSKYIFMWSRNQFKIKAKTWNSFPLAALMAWWIASLCSWSRWIHGNDGAFPKRHLTRINLSFSYSHSAWLMLLKEIKDEKHKPMKMNQKI